MPLSIDTSSLPAPFQVEHEGRQEVLVPVLLRITVDPLDGFTEEEAIQVALERLEALELDARLSGVPIPVHADVPIRSAHS
jgi:hypothetical protein